MWSLDLCHSNLSRAVIHCLSSLFIPLWIHTSSDIIAERVVVDVKQCRSWVQRANNRKEAPLPLRLLRPLSFPQISSIFSLSKVRSMFDAQSVYLRISARHRTKNGRCASLPFFCAMIPLQFRPSHLLSNPLFPRVSF